MLNALFYYLPLVKKVQVGNDQEMAQSERNAHSINRGVGKNKMTLKGIGPQTIVCALYKSLRVAEQLATNFMKINQGVRKL